MKNAKRTLKHAELHILRDFVLWCSDARAWGEAQEILRKLRYSLRQVVQN